MAMSDNSKAVLKFLQANDGKDITAQDIVDATGIDMRKVTGAVNRAFIAHKKTVGEDKVDDPLAYRDEVAVEGGVVKYIRLTDAGKAFDTEA